MSVYNKKSFYVRGPFRLILLTAIVLAAYYPAVWGEFCGIDDQNLIASLKSRTSWSLKDEFIPRMQNAIYYRPLVLSSFYFDKYLWNLDPGFMHLVNIALHVFNSLLLYWLAYQLLPDDRRKASFVPLFSALFFGLHPINAESVNWISARTDVLACTFILLSANCLIKYKRDATHLYLAAFALFMTLAFLTKEVALAFLPGAFLMLTSHDHAEAAEAAAGRRSLFYRQNGLVFLTAVLVAAALFFFFRSAATFSQLGRIWFTIQAFLNFKHATFVFLGAFAFYIKKIIIPFPLNFAILEVEPLYELLSLPLLFLCLLIFPRRTTRSAIFLAGIILIAPALVIALNQIAWTPFAERYMYLPSAFLMVSFVSYGSSLSGRIPVPLKRTAIGAFLIIMAITTFYRSTVWMSNLSLFKDTVEKNPEFHLARGAYAVALTEKGDFENAKKQFALAKEEYHKRIHNMIRTPFYDNRLGYWEAADLGVARALELEGKLYEAVKAYEFVFDMSNGRSAYALNRLVFLYSDMLLKETGRSGAARIERKLARYTRDPRGMNLSPHALYAVGKAYMARGDRQGALAHFRKARDRFEDGNVYKQFSAQAVARLEKN